jgi:hypothetical protein
MEIIFVVLSIYLTDRGFSSSSQGSLVEVEVKFFEDHSTWKDEFVTISAKVELRTGSWQVTTLLKYHGWILKF